MVLLSKNFWVKILEKSSGPIPDALLAASD